MYEISRVLYFYPHQHFSHSHDQRWERTPGAHLEDFAFINNYRRKVVKMALERERERETVEKEVE